MKPTTIKDSQRTAVYRWIENFPVKEIGEDLSLEQCREIVGRIWEDYCGPSSKPPVVTDGRGKRRPSGSRNRIKLPRRTRTRLTVLHEVAHAIQDNPPLWGEKPNQPWHSPEFATLLVDLCNRYLRLDPQELRHQGEEQKPRRVRFAHQSAIPIPKRPVVPLGGNTDRG